MLAVQQQHPNPLRDSSRSSSSSSSGMGYKHHYGHHGGHHGGGGGGGVSGGLAPRKKMYITYNDANVPAKIALTKISRRTKVLVYGKKMVCAE